MKVARNSAGSMLRHRLPSQPVASRPGVRTAARVCRRGRSALRVSWTVVRVSRTEAQRACAGTGEGAGRHGAFGKRRQHVRVEGRPQRRDHNGIRRGRRPHDGNSLRCARSRCHPLHDAGARHGTGRGRGPHLQAVRPVSGVSSDMRALRASPDPAAREAIALFAYRIVREVGSRNAAGAASALVFSRMTSPQDDPGRGR